MNNIGIDIVKIERIEKLKKNKKFIEKIFTENEIKYIEKRRYNSQTIAGLYACKEAISKAIGTGIGEIAWKEIEVKHSKKGKPYGIILKNIEGYNCKETTINISITHEKEYALAVVEMNGNKDKNFLLEIKPPLYLKKRKKNSHKGNYGRTIIIGGSKGMSGSVYLAGSSCLKMGAGLVHVLVPKEINEILSIKFNEVIINSPLENSESFKSEHFEYFKKITEDADAVAIGPGLGWDEEKTFLMEKFIEKVDIPTVIDADGLNCISKNTNIFKKKKNKIIITPHIGEMGRLINKSNSYVEENYIEIAKKFSLDYGVVTVLKKNETVVANPNGEIYINKTGNPGMATAGSGDVLTGIIVSLVGQGYDVFSSAKLGVYIHGLAGDLAEKKHGEYSLIASNIIECLNEATKLCLK